ncbi:PcfB family protein [Oscillospiraceae bacterium OttesenSCG-928-G22]|nr:PcfB family protein [Oscillospiraceae bacterium OttesenSCG-928-G22]
MQEQIDREAVAVTVKASKLTAQVLAKVLSAVGRKIQKEHRKAQTPHGRQSVKKLMNHNVPTNTIPIDGDKGLFDKVARKWKVDYAFHKTGPDKYLLLFKTGQADAITAAFSEYSSLVVRRAKDKRPPVMEEFAKAKERSEREKPKHKERKRSREVARE